MGGENIVNTLCKGNEEGQWRLIEGLNRVVRAVFLSF
jgi:hypothetical protein